MNKFHKMLTAVGVALLLAVTPQAGADEALDLREHEGKVIVLDFWASWCVPCRRSFPWWNAMNAKYGHDGLVIIGVNLDNDLSSAAGFLEEFPADFIVYYDKDKSLAKSFGVQAMPSTFIIGRDGEIQSKHYGFKVRQQDRYEASIVDALRSGA